MILNWQPWHHQPAELKPAEVKTKSDIGCHTADKMEKEHISPAFGINNKWKRENLSGGGPPLSVNTSHE